MGNAATIIKLGQGSRAGAIAQTAAALRAGGVAAIPTDTVYGFCCLLGQEAALARIRTIKNQPEDKPFQILAATVAEAKALCAPLPRTAEKLMRIFWPGALTLVLPAPGGGTVGIRLPDHPDTRAILRECGHPLCATSANRHGAEPATDGAAVIAEFAGEVDLILDGGTVRGGVASSVAAVDGAGRLKVLREGAISQAELEEAARPLVLVAGTDQGVSAALAASVLGRMLSETRPDARVSAACPAIDSRKWKLPAGAAKLLAVMGYGGSQKPVALDAQQLDRADLVLALTPERKEYLETSAPWLQGRVWLVEPVLEEFVKPGKGLAGVGPGYGEMVVRLEKALWTLSKKAAAALA